MSSASPLIQLWNDLGGEDPTKAFAAKWALIARADDALPFLRSRLDRGGGDSDEAAVSRLIDELDDADPATRRRATEKLVRSGPAAAVPVLVKMASPDNTPETRARLAAIVQTFTVPTGGDPELLRRARALHALEIILGLPNETRQTALELPATPKAPSSPTPRGPGG